MEKRKFGEGLGDVDKVKDKIVEYICGERAEIKKLRGNWEVFLRL